jgi:hypothetical protein
MPAISLVVCVFRQRDLLSRLLDEATGCYDELIVVHDGSEEKALNDEQKVETLTKSHGGRFLVGPRSHQQEPHWPMAWKEARHNWILRLDADEVPSADLKKWLQAFRVAPEPIDKISGYTCNWPLWDSTRIVTQRWPSGRQFLFHRERVRFFGMVEQVPTGDYSFEALPFILEHRPNRKSYGLHNLLLRRQAYEWRRVIVFSLLGKPTDLPCWRWTSAEWPPVWEEIRQKPLRTAVKRLLLWPVYTARDMKRTEGRTILSPIVCSGIHHCLISLAYWQARLFRSHD